MVSVDLNPDEINTEISDSWQYIAKEEEKKERDSQ